MIPLRGQLAFVGSFVWLSFEELTIYFWAAFDVQTPRKRKQVPLPVKLDTIKSNESGQSLTDVVNDLDYSVIVFFFTSGHFM